MSLAWQDHEQARRQARLRCSQSPLWQDVALWVVCAGLIAAVWLVVARVF